MVRMDAVIMFNIGKSLDKPHNVHVQYVLE